MSSGFLLCCFCLFFFFFGVPGYSFRDWLANRIDFGFFVCFINFQFYSPLPPSNVCQSLFARHKLLFSFLLAVRIMDQTGEVSLLFSFMLLLLWLGWSLILHFSLALLFPYRIAQLIHNYIMLSTPSYLHMYYYFVSPHPLAVTGLGFVVLLSTLMCCQPTKLILGFFFFFCFINFPISPPFLFFVWSLPLRQYSSSKFPSFYSPPPTRWTPSSGDSFYPGRP